MNAIDLKAAVENPKADWYTVALIRLIFKASADNRKKLERLYPVEVAAVRIYKTTCPYLATKEVDYDTILVMAEKEAKPLEGNPKMTLETWAVETSKDLTRFLDFWEDRNHRDSENFPNELPAGEFDEQFRIFGGV